MGDIPEWAIDRARKLTGMQLWTNGAGRHHTPLDTFARYIAEHEEPPVDPREAGLREAWKQALSVYHATHIDKGSQDAACVNRLRSVLEQRGLKIVEERP